MMHPTMSQSFDCKPAMNQQQKAAIVIPVPRFTQDMLDHCMPEMKENLADATRT